MVALIGYSSQDSAKMMNEIDRFPETFAKGREACCAIAARISN
jgi:hypothetical protein